MKTKMFGMLAETSIHCGAGRTTGIIDQPVAREAATDYPFIAGSSLKGALRDRAKSLDGVDVDELFGKPEHAGRLLVSDARLVLLPVRSLSGAYKWATCPLLLERYGRDRKRCGLPDLEPIVGLSRIKGISNALASGVGGKLYLEEREFDVRGELPAKLCDAVAPLICHEQTRQRLLSQVVILSDDDFAWFCRFALPIQARNALQEDGSKRSKNLWYEETLPSDTVLYAVTTTRDTASKDALETLFPSDDPYLQVGGNETVGNGWMCVSICDGGTVS